MRPPPSPARRATLDLAAVLAVCAAFPVPAAFAQNPSEIARVKAGANCPGCNLFQADLQGLELRGKNLAGARLRQADLSAGVFTRSRFAHSDLRDLNGYGAVFTGADLRGANLTAASFVGAYLQGADLTGATLAGANFSGAEMSRARGLTRAQLAGACGDRATTLPKGLSLPPCA